MTDWERVWVERLELKVNCCEGGSSLADYLVFESVEALSEHVCFVFERGEKEKRETAVRRRR